MIIAAVLAFAPLPWNTAPAAEGDAAARGAYLAVAGSCESCHTAEGGRPYAGGRALETPFGVLLTPNLTPHPTGLGGWDLATFDRAIREGVNGDDAAMYPAHPYAFFTRMTDADIGALWAFVQGLEPVDNEVEVVQLPFPYDRRLGVAAWRATFFEEERFAPDPARSALWNRGAYLVRAVAHCGACHTPRNVALALREDQALEGGKVRGWYAPDISAGNGSAIDGWSVDRLVTYLREGATDDRVTAFGPMEEVVHGTLSELEEDDYTAIATYLLNTAPPEAREASLAVASFPGLSEGRAIYDRLCVGCHQPNGEGLDGAAASLVDNGSILAPQPNNVVMALLGGLAASDSWPAMPAVGSVLSDREVASVTNYVRTAWSNDAVPNATPGLVADLRREVDDVPANQPWQAGCPNLPRDLVDGELVDRVRQVSQDGLGDAEAEALLQTYADRFPDVGMGRAMIALNTAHCRVVNQRRLSHADALQVLGDFSAQIARASATARSEPTP